MGSTGSTRLLVGTDFYLRRADDRTRYFLGKSYALARYLEGLSPFVVTDQEVPGVVSLAVRDLAELVEIGAREDGDPEALLAPTGRDEHGTSLRLIALAEDVARWSGGRPISLVAEDGFDDWHEDDAWDADASSLFFTG